MHLSFVLSLILIFTSCNTTDTCDGNGYSECWDGSAVCDVTDCPEEPTDPFYVYYNSNVDIAGFQFNINGADVLSAGGGDATAAGFTISNSASTVLGFNLTGGTIAAGEGTLIELEVSNAGGCLSDVVFSDALGIALQTTVIDCHTIILNLSVSSFTKNIDLLMNNIIISKLKDISTLF